VRRALSIAGGLALTALGTVIAAQPRPGPIDTPPASPGVVPVPPVAPASSPLPIGPAYDDDASLPAHADDVASYTLRVSLDPLRHTLKGEGVIRWRNASRVAQRELAVHLYLNAFKNEESVFLRTPSSGFRGGGSPDTFGHISVRRFEAREIAGDLWSRARSDDPTDETAMRVPLPRDVAPGETLTIDIAWDAQLPPVTLRTGHSKEFHMVAQWFPKLAKLEPDGRWAHFPLHRFSEFYADYGTYDVTVDVPEPFIVGATGRLDGETRAGGRSETRWVQRDVHDFAFTAWHRFRALTEDVDGVKVTVLHPPGLERAARVELDSVRFGLAHLGQAYGRYPYETLTVVHPPEGAEEAGGMEYPTLITTGGPWYLPGTGVRFLEVVTVHELAHQWFYGLVATNENAWPFLDEGLTSFVEGEALEAWTPGASATSTFGMRFGLPAVHRMSGLAAGQNDEIAQSAEAFQTGGDYGGLVYYRTATLLETLGRVYGEANLKRALGRYARRYRFEHPGPEELIAAIDDVLGGDAASALRTALFQRGWVDYAVEDLVSEAASAPRGVFGDPGAPVSAPEPTGTGFRGHALVRRRGTLVFPVDVELVSADGSAQRVRWDARESVARIPFEGASPLAAVIIDPEHRVLLDEQLGNNAQRRQGRGLIAPRVLDRGSFAAGAALLLEAP
jgi:hypothetical protein